MWGKRLVGTRVKLARNLIDEIPERGHRPDKNDAISAVPREVMFGNSPGSDDKILFSLVGRAG
jgi:hypothetical protein